MKVFNQRPRCVDIFLIYCGIKVNTENSLQFTAFQADAGRESFTK
jgi:hypothetical protein